MNPRKKAFEEFERDVVKLCDEFGFVFAKRKGVYVLVDWGEMSVADADAVIDLLNATLKVQKEEE